MSSQPPVWFITGSSTGFGRAVVETVLAKGGIAVATLRTPSALADLAAQYPPDRLLLVRLDVTKTDEIAEAFAKAKEAFGRIDVVYNNAGLALIGEVESVPSSLREMHSRHLYLQVLFWGAVNVTRKALEYFRENKPIGGRLIQVSSFYGILGESGSGFYSATKFGIEGLTQALAKEIEPEWNIKITLCEPGPFLTNIKENAHVSMATHPAYTPMRDGKYRCDPLNIDLNGDKDKAAKAIWKLGSLPDPPLHLPLHKEAVRALRVKAAELLRDADAYESWSDDMLLDQ
ncbi:hypothetical protein BDQ17DRAFT_1419323 [Cyathus striatus]|nr:hypothetical protein BDQ17DRAFT_1419323 [Cyathus striatus]